MKINKYLTILATASLFWACSADEGEMPGSDPTAAVTLYTYAPTDENLNPDNDVVVRFVTNDKVSSLKYMIIPSTDVASILSSSGEQGLVSKVETDGKAISDVKGNSSYEVTVTDLHGEYTAVAVVNGGVLSNKVTYVGLDWATVKHGTFYAVRPDKFFNPAQVAAEATLDVCTTDETLYRVNNAFGEGTAIKMNLLDVKAADSDGDVYTLFRVSATKTPWTVGNYGIASVRDIGYWQGNSAFVTSATGYENGLYEDGSAFFCLQWFVSAGNLGFTDSYFIPNN